MIKIIKFNKSISFCINFCNHSGFCDPLSTCANSVFILHTASMHFTRNSITDLKNIYHFCFLRQDHFVCVHWQTPA